MGRRSFKRGEILDAILAQITRSGFLADYGDDYTTAMMDWADSASTYLYEQVKQLVFELDGKHWQIEYEVSGEAGYNELFLGHGIDSFKGKPWYDTKRTFQADEVRPETATITIWVPVE